MDENTPQMIRCPSCGAKNRVRASAQGVPRCARCKHVLPWITIANEASFDVETHAGVAVIVDFWASWCAPCRMITPVLETFAATHAGHLKVVQVNVDENPGLTQRWRAMGIPLLVVLRDAVEVDRIEGVLPQDQLERRLAPMLEPAPG
jgi:thioredoxin 2